MAAVRLTPQPLRWVLRCARTGLYLRTSTVRASDARGKGSRCWSLDETEAVRFKSSAAAADFARRNGLEDVAGFELGRPLN